MTNASLELKLRIPDGWVEHPNPGGPRELRPRPDGQTGLLQVSELAASDAPFVFGQPDLGAFAAAFGARLGAGGQSWGTAAAHKAGPCALGKYGFAMFRGGEFPAMLLWVTASERRALLWTWLGPDPGAPEVGQALRVVLEAT